jgi:hypothetical protein
MPRPSKGPRLADEGGMYYIRDTGGVHESTGVRVDESNREGSKAEAEKKLAAYILRKHDPAKALRDAGHPNQAKIADVIADEMRQIEARTDLGKHRKTEFIGLYERMNGWFGERVVGDLTGRLQEKYIAERMRYVTKKVNGELTPVKTDELAPGAAYRDLKLLAGAINRYIQRDFGGAQLKFRPTLPDAPTKRSGFFRTRSEAARFIWTAWRMRREGTGEYMWRHIARYTLVGLYSGSRNGDICGAALMPTIGRGYIDTENGFFRRKPTNKQETSKHQPTVPLHPKLLAHIRRWKRKGIAKTAVVEFRGKPVAVVKEGWRTVAAAAGFSIDPKDADKIVRHSVRHTAITWYMTGLHSRAPHVKGERRRPGKKVDIGTVSQYCGVSEKVIREHYRHLTEGTFTDIVGFESAG